jgi:hypothetical protein
LEQIFCIYAHISSSKQKVACKTTTKPKVSSKLYLQAPPLHFTPTKFLETFHEKRRIHIFPPK